MSYLTPSFHHVLWTLHSLPNSAPWETSLTFLLRPCAVGDNTVLSLHFYVPRQYQVFVCLLLIYFQTMVVDSLFNLRRLFPLLTVTYLIWQYHLYIPGSVCFYWWLCRPDFLSRTKQWNSCIVLLVIEVYMFSLTEIFFLVPDICNSPSSSFSVLLVYQKDYHRQLTSCVWHRQVTVKSVMALYSFPRS